MDAAWCFLCRIDQSGVDPRAAWGLDAFDGPLDEAGDPTDPMTDQQERHLRFLCEEFGVPFGDPLTRREAALALHRFAQGPMPETQKKTLAWLSERQGTSVDLAQTYGQARTTIRRLVALRGLKSA